MTWKFWRCDKHQSPPTAAKFCIECGVAYEPRPVDQWPSYCIRCRKPKAELQGRKDRVLRWAEATFEQHEETAKAWMAEKDAAAARMGAGTQWSQAEIDAEYHRRAMQNQSTVRGWY
jgi:hypothetical protein